MLAQSKTYIQDAHIDLKTNILSGTTTTTTQPFGCSRNILWNIQIYWLTQHKSNILSAGQQQSPKEKRGSCRMKRNCVKEANQAIIPSTLVTLLYLHYTSEQLSLFSIYFKHRGLKQEQIELGLCCVLFLLPILGKEMYTNKYTYDATDFLNCRNSWDEEK